MHQLLNIWQAGKAEVLAAETPELKRKALDALKALIAELVPSPWAGFAEFGLSALESTIK